MPGFPYFLHTIFTIKSLSPASVLAEKGNWVPCPRVRDFLNKLFRIILWGRLVFSCLSLYLTISLYWYGPICTYIMSYNPTPHYLIYLIFFFQFYEWRPTSESVIAKRRPKSKMLRFLLFEESYIIPLFLFLKQSLLSDTMKYSRLMLYFTCFNPRISCLYKCLVLFENGI